MGIGGSASKTDRSTTLAGYGGLENLFNFAIPAAKNLVSTGADAISQSLGYYSKLLSGNRPAMQQAIAPEANAALAQSDAQKRQLAATGTARGGGTAAINQNRKTATDAEIDNMLFGAQSSAAKTTGALGTSTVGAGTNLASTGEAAAADLTKSAVQSQEESNAQGNMIGQGIAQLIFGIA